MKNLNVRTTESAQPNCPTCAGSKVNNVKPVIKLSPNGILLYANSTGIDFIDLLTAYTREPAIKYILDHCPGMLDPHCNLDICCKVFDMKYYFSVVAFKEAGYVGLYGYRVVHVNSSDSMVA